MPSITYSRVVCLSHVIAPGIPCWPGDPPVEFEAVADLKQQGYRLRRFSVGEHSATHLNAPAGFFLARPGVDAFPPAALVAPAVLLDVQVKAAVNPDYTICQEDILGWEKEHGQLPAGSVVVVLTGWQERWQSPETFFNQDGRGQMHYPGFGQDCTRWLLAERGIAGVGTDAPGVEPGSDSTYSVNRLLLADGWRIVLENLTGLEQLPPRGATLVIGILRLKDGTGSPASVLAFIP